MSRARLLAAYGVIVLFVGGSILDLCRDTEHWPWSCYPMYSFPERGETFDDIRLYGVTTDNTEIALFDNEQYLQPFDQSRLAEALGQAARKPGLRDGLLNCLERYERLRREGRHNGPALSAIRMYKVYWHLDGWGRNIDSPDKMELLQEVQLPDNQKS